MNGECPELSPIFGEIGFFLLQAFPNAGEKFLVVGVPLEIGPLAHLVLFCSGEKVQFHFEPSLEGVASLFSQDFEKVLPFDHLKPKIASIDKGGEAGHW